MSAPARDRTHHSLGIDWAGLTVFTLALSVGTGWAGTVLALSIGGTALSADALSTIDSLGQTMVTGVIAYLAYSVGRDYGEFTRKF